MTKLITGW